ncbi:flagellar export chaperone FliS [Bradyrhizobium oligotrophicum]|uniref:flagellar export chaperone FliS n=1 Tax=Bradyrhizobium oligotrophicum TaxID=44255 RepID=UPI003EB9442E
MTQSSMAHIANQAYRGAAVAVPPLRAVVMLLNGAVSYLQKSLQAQEARRFEEGHAHLTRATAILRGLSLHLDPIRGGVVADQLFTTYNALIVAALRSYGRPHMRENFQRITNSLLELRDAWDAADAATRVARLAGDSGSRR